MNIIVTIIVGLFLWSGICWLFGWSDTSKECNYEKGGFEEQLRGDVIRWIANDPIFPFAIRDYANERAMGNIPAVTTLAVLNLKNIKLSESFKKGKEDGVTKCSVFLESKLDFLKGKAYYRVKKEGDKVIYLGLDKVNPNYRKKYED